MKLRLFAILAWGFVGFLSLYLGNRFGSFPCSLGGEIDLKIASIPILKITHLFVEFNFYRFFMFFISTMVLSFFSFFNISRMIALLVCYNYSPLISIYLFYFTDKWSMFKPGSTEYQLLASMPMFCIISILIALLGCRAGVKLRNYYIKSSNKITGQIVENDGK